MTPMVPAWVTKRDGRREPFDADKISQGLYAATEAIGKPNAFLARELADSVLHFLGQENTADTVATAQIAELVEKVVRELGHSELARVFARISSEAVLATEPAPAARPLNFSFSVDEEPEVAERRFLATYGLHAVFGRDLAAADESGVLSLYGLSAPRLLGDMVVEPLQSQQASISSWHLGWMQVGEASGRSNGCLIVDGAEWLATSLGPGWLDGFLTGLHTYGRRAVLNLNPPTPPPWASQIGAGPLFARGNEPDVAALQNARSMIVESYAKDHVREWALNWHLQAKDFEDSRRSTPLDPLLGCVNDLRTITFTLDRPRRPVLMHCGLDRDHPVVCQCVGLALPDFLRLPGIAGDGAKMIAKLPSLARMAVSAGVQKRNYLRRHRSELNRAFFLDRARLKIDAWDLEEVVELISGARPAQSALAADVGRQLLQSLRDAAVQAGQAAGLDVAVVNSQGLWVDDTTGKLDEPAAAWQAAGTILEVIDSGTVSVRLATASVEAVWRHLRLAWRIPSITQVRFAPAS